MAVSVTPNLHMKRFFTTYFIIFLACCAILPSTAGAKNQDIAPTLQDRYRKSKFFYQQLETREELGSQRELWLKASRNFRKVYLANPKSELAPASLFLLGRIYLRMYEKFNIASDLKESIGYYKDCASLFPHHRLADDSLFSLGNIFTSVLNEPDTGARYYSDIVAKYPRGDMHPEAAKHLKTLSSTHDIALPEVMLNGTSPKKLTNVLPVKYWSSEDYSRVIIKASGPVTYSAQLLEKSGSKPRRLYIDFFGSYIEPRYRSPVPISDGLLKRIRTGQHTQETVRVVLDIESISNYKIFSLPDPFRVVVDVRGEEKPQSPASSKPLRQLEKPKLRTSQIIVLREQKKNAPGNQPPDEADHDDLETDGGELTLAQQLGLGVRKIVIDPGHGGKDPGAIAHNLKEKDIVLRLAHKLKKDLENTIGCEVVLTRSDDRFISLEERTAIANGNNADLFLSLHVNAHPVASVSGLETYFLNLTNNRESMRVAAFENATSELQMSDLQDVLADIMKNSKIKESSRLAHNVHASLVNGLEADNLVLKDLGVKQAPFYVLIGAEMPAVLIEVAFISNPDEATKLRDDFFLSSSSKSITNGILAYIESNSARLRF